ncbi:hypothetical protein [Silvimonas amylolytica]|uniref:CHRD domain-containing protein n=1 Tax=Silvimonas amylolytica TaxID=449663 RepID=A0ABQ2PS42_9NEIS|nr:hypothetical protein [Silvimonas amylolytica]GGP28171.1 hypothetical protein GCM10010971_39900 [Silvimonas amylolytica]
MAATLRSLCRLWLIACLSVACLSARAESLDGTYVGQIDRTVYMLQIVTTRNAQWTGRLEQTFVDTDGQTQTQSAPVNGRLSGPHLVTQLSQANLDMGIVALGSTFKARVLQLTIKGGASTQLYHTDEYAYQRQIAALKTHR